MSKTSMKERNKAIRKAWEREQVLVQEGKGTRDWTTDQQADILDPNRGKAYDDQGRAFVGQHMKSAAKYPEYQGDPDNIQFLTYYEHLEAHKGSWQNPTNWYYDPVTKEYTDFGDNSPTPCEIIELSDPVIVPEPVAPLKVDEKEQSAKDGNADNGTHTSKKSTDNAPPKNKIPSSSSATNDKLEKPYTARAEKTSAKSTSLTRLSNPAKSHKVKNGFVKGLKTMGRFIVNHPVESIEIVGTVIVGGIELVSAISGTRNKSNGSSIAASGSSTTNSPKTDIAAKVADIVEKATRAENDVKGHKQRYHTKDGVIWKDKAPYHRPRKDS